MLSGYLNQTVIYQPKTGTDGRGQPTYAEPVTVSCRHQPKIQNILTKDGQSVQTQHIYYLDTAVHDGDMLDGKIIIASSEWADFGGKSTGYKAVV